MLLLLLLGLLLLQRDSAPECSGSERGPSSEVTDNSSESRAEQRKLLTICTKPAVHMLLLLLALLVLQCDSIPECSESERRRSNEVTDNSESRAEQDKLLTTRTVGTSAKLTAVHLQNQVRDGRCQISKLYIRKSVREAGGVQCFNSSIF